MCAKIPAEGELMKDCVFCQKRAPEVFAENDLAKAFYDSYPVNIGHTLIVTKRHIADFFEATPAELAAINELIFKMRERLHTELRPDGYNIGVNVGSSAGQTVFHLHFHLIPRFTGDTENPRGGVRKVKKSMVPYP
jgi:diadenosine tetraphosphate (Ap4A) HIT family hydrolase